MRAPTATVTIRPAYPEDDAVIRRLAALDSAKVPAEPFLLAEVEGEPLAALSLSDDRVIADPFHPTVRIVAMLRAYASAPARTTGPRASGRGYRRSRFALEY